MYNPAVSVRPPALKIDQVISPLRRIKVYPWRTAISFAAGTPEFLGGLLDRGALVCGFDFPIHARLVPAS
jgi:hypothetical protein